MRIPDRLYVEWVDNEAVVLDSDGEQLHYLNPTAALVFALIKESGLEGAKAELQGRFASEPEFEDELATLLESMRAKGLLEDD